MSNQSDNCMACGIEYDEEDLKPIALSTLHVTKFKICVSCLDKSNPADDYKEARSIALAYLSLEELLKNK